MLPYAEDIKTDKKTVGVTDIKHDVLVSKIWGASGRRVFKSFGNVSLRQICEFRSCITHRICRLQKTA